MSEAHGGLKLPPLAGVGASEESNIHRRWDMADDVTKYLEMELGMAPPREPDYACPELRVEDLTNPDSKAYTEFYAKLTAWYGYLSEKKAEHDAVVIEIVAEMEDIETTVRDIMRKNNSRKTRSGETKNPTGKEMEDAVNRHPRYLELKQEHVRRQEILARLNARIDRLDRELRLTSRQVEIKRLDFETTNRGSRIGGQGGMPAPGFRHPSRPMGGGG